MQPKDIKVIMISYGDDSFHKNKSGVLDRHITYASYFDELFIIHLTKSKGLELISLENLTIKPIYKTNYFFAFITAVFFLIKKRRFKYFKIVTTQDPFLTGLLGLIAAKILKIKLHIQNHSVYINNKNWLKERPFLNPVLNFIGIKIIKSADRLRVVNSHEKEIYCKDLKIKSNKIDIAPVPSNDKFWNSKYNKQKTQNFKEKHNLKNKLIFGWAGRLVKFKRVDFLFEICSDLKKKGYKNFELLIAGDLENSEYNLKALEHKYKINPIYLGYLDQDKLLEFYNSIDVYLHTSIYEGYGLVVKEAQLVGIPVVSVRTEGPSKIIIDGITGNLVEDELDSFSNILSCYFKASFFNEIKKAHFKRKIDSMKIKTLSI